MDHTLEKNKQQESNENERKKLNLLSKKVSGYLRIIFNIKTWVTPDRRILNQTDPWYM